MFLKFNSPPTHHRRDMLEISSLFFFFFYAAKALSKIKKKKFQCFYRLSKEGTRNEAKFILGKVKFEPMRPADLLSRARALRGARLGSRAFYILPYFCFRCGSLWNYSASFPANLSGYGPQNGRKSGKVAPSMHVCIYGQRIPAVSNTCLCVWRLSYIFNSRSTSTNSSLIRHWKPSCLQGRRQFHSRSNIDRSKWWCFLSRW